VSTSSSSSSSSSSSKPKSELMEDSCRSSLWHKSPWRGCTIFSICDRSWIMALVSIFVIRYCKICCARRGRRSIQCACTTLALVPVFSASGRLSGLGLVPPASVQLSVVRSSFPCRYNGSSRTFSHGRCRHQDVEGENSRMVALCRDRTRAGRRRRRKQREH
jgi:hypothetical protein